MASLREQKEAFVSGHRGTTVSEIAAASAAPVVLLALWRLMAHPASGADDLCPGEAGVAGLALEFAVLILPHIAHLLGLASPSALLGGVIVLAAALLATQNSSEWQNRGREARRRPLTDVLRDSLSAYRASLMFVTCIAILGVDYQAFPRRFAKAERFGTGLMDAGVGSFVAASGLAHGLSAAARIAVQQRPTQRWRTEGRRALALLALGLGRVLGTRAADYQSHASEYGVHWNFFLTLGALRLLGMATPWATSSAAAAAVTASIVLAAHQFCLSAMGAIDLVHSDERAGGLLLANKEGLLSLPGYWALQLLGTAAGHAAHRMGAAAAARAAAAQPQPAGSGSGPERGRLRSSSDGSSHGSGSSLSVRVKAVPQQPWGAAVILLAQLAAATLALWLAYWAAVATVQPVSRRACNAAYVLWMLALNVQCCALFVAAELLLPGPMPQLLTTVSSRMLPVFLAANLLTGAVNLTTNTLAASHRTALLLLTAYMAVLCGGALLANGRNHRGLSAAEAVALLRPG
ncbi:hypothetical protein D9Q98_003126 [Chlorella vulgaris]|uniref:GPI-anchored wall transfer protein n=1 Tax=Chlorella vulgaris TaxID=3077 RepID=A0A9D4YYG9_CHLVU|nr:hypothetical protein D9Q98_003126 [Chlorella vulgaris]